jgi:hypothetical protein
MEPEVKLNAPAAAIHKAAAAFNQATQVAVDAGLDVSVDVVEHRSLSRSNRPMPTLKAHVSLPPTGKEN